MFRFDLLPQTVPYPNKVRLSLFWDAFCKKSINGTRVSTVVFAVKNPNVKRIGVKAEFIAVGFAIKNGIFSIR